MDIKLKWEYIWLRAYNKVRSLIDKEMIKGKIEEISYEIWIKITIWDILHKQSECTVTKQMYGSKFEKKISENFRLKILEQFWNPVPGIDWD